MAAMRYVVKQGECVSSVAFKYGFFPDTIWDDPKNSELRAKREDPNILLAGDEVYVRDKEEKEESCASEQRHRFRRKGVPEILRVQIRVGGEPRANEIYDLEIDGISSEGKTDDDGMVEVWIAPNAMRAKITFRESGDEYDFVLGKLDPITKISGVQARLRSLGFFKGAIDGEMSEELEDAIRGFQQTNELNPSGTPDDGLRNKLAELYGS